MKKVFKVQLVGRPGDPINVQMAIGAEVIHVDTQRGRVCVWFECLPTASPQPRTFYLVFTGEPVPDNAIHRGTTLTNKGAIVLHVYEKQ